MPDLTTTTPVDNFLASESQEEMLDAIGSTKRPIEGIEFLAPWHEKIQSAGGTPATKPTIVISGTSVIFGDRYFYGIPPEEISARLPENDRIDVILQRMLIANGFSSAQVVNSGHSGSNVSQFASSFAASDSAFPMNLYITQWGTNDPSGGIEAYEENYRSGLTEFRSAKPWPANGLIILSPPMINDPANGRDIEWLRKIDPVQRRLAKEFKGAFVDLVTLFPSITDGVGITMDAPYADGTIAIHPLGALNRLFADSLRDVIIPPGIRESYLENSRISVRGSERLPVVTDSFSTYPNGRSCYAATSANGWPYDGWVITEKMGDGLTTRQTNFSGVSSDFKTRNGQPAYGWFAWV